MQIEDLRKLLVFHRKRAGLTQVELAQHTGVSRTVVQDLESGKGRASFNHVITIMSVLNISLEPKGPLVEEWQSSRKDMP